MSVSGSTNIEQREADYLSDPGGYLLKASIEDATAPFDFIQPWSTRRPKGRAVFVLRKNLALRRWNGTRSVTRHNMLLKVRWPMDDSGGVAENDQARLSAAIDQLVSWIAGPMLDKSHGGRFLQAPVGGLGQLAPVINVSFTDAEQAIARSEPLRCEITYQIDDTEHNQ